MNGTRRDHWIWRGRMLPVVTRVTDSPVALATHSSVRFCTVAEKATREPSDEMAASVTSIVGGWVTRWWMSSQSMSSLLAAPGADSFCNDITYTPVLPLRLLRKQIFLPSALQVTPAFRVAKRVTFFASPPAAGMMYS